MLGAALTLLFMCDSISITCKEKTRVPGTRANTDA